MERFWLQRAQDSSFCHPLGPISANSPSFVSYCAVAETKTVSRAGLYIGQCLSSLSRGIEDYTHAIGQLLERGIDPRTVYASEPVLEATPAELGALADVVFDFPAHSPSEVLSIVAQEEANLRLAATLIAEGKLVACRRGETDQSHLSARLVSLTRLHTRFSLHK